MGTHDFVMFLRYWAGNKRFNAMPYERQAAVARRLGQRRWAIAMGRA